MCVMSVRNRPVGILIVVLGLPRLEKKAVYGQRRMSVRRLSVRPRMLHEQDKPSLEDMAKKRRRRNLLFSVPGNRSDRLSKSYCLAPLMPLVDGLPLYLVETRRVVVVTENSEASEVKYKLVKGPQRLSLVNETDLERSKRMTAEAEAEAQATLLLGMKDGIVRDLVRDALRQKYIRHG